MQERKEDTPIPIHPAIGELSGREHATLAIEGFVGPAESGRIRIYEDLSLGVCLEMAASDVLHVDEAPSPREPGRIVFRRDAELALVTTVRLNADQAFTAVMSAPATPTSGSCTCRGEATGVLAQQVGGGGPVIDICSWSCVERLQLCLRNKGALGRFWCYVKYGACKVGCTPPVIVV